ncbi:MAG: PD40 domain-containing protein [Chloroflexi bacterium]|nr:PD40 domain-containing protein [Chloroflexota bacterium]
MPLIPGRLFLAILFAFIALPLLPPPTVSTVVAPAAATQSLGQLTETSDGYFYTGPVLSADGSRIAYWSEGRREIYVIGGDGDGQHTLVGDPFRANGPPSISGDGQWIAFAAFDSEKAGNPWYSGDIYVRRFDLSVFMQLTSSPTNDDQIHLAGARGNPAISGDGSRVVFSSSADFLRQNGDGSAELFMLRANGTGGLGQLTNFVDIRGPNPGDLIVQYTAFAPAIDHIASRVAFILRELRMRRTDGGADILSDTHSLYVVNTNGSGRRELATVSTTYSPQEYLGERPAISGDGSTVAFPAYINVGGGNPDGGLEIFTIKTDGSGFRQLTSTAGRSAYPSLSFDGSRVAFTSYEPTDFERRAYEVYVMNTDGTGLRKLTSTLGDPTVRRTGFEGVALSADGTCVAFSSSGDLLGKNADGNYEIYLRRLTSLVAVQGIRNLSLPDDLRNNRRSLVAKRDLVVRAFFDTGLDGPSTLARGRLIVDEGTANERSFQVNDYMARALGYFADKPDARQRLEDSLKFFITGAVADNLLTPGIHTFKAVIEPQSAGAFPSFEETFRANFRQPDSVEVFVIPVRVRNAAGVYVEPEAAVLRSAADHLRSYYPLDEQEVRVTILNPHEVDAPLTTIDRRRTLANDLLGRLQAQLNHGQVATPAKHNFAAGVVPYNVDGQNPLGQTAGGGERLGYTFPAIRGVVVTLDREPYGTNERLVSSTVAHEIGHLFDLGDEYAGGRPSAINPPPAAADDGDSVGNYVQEVAGGLDTTNRSAVFTRSGNERYGFMGGGNDRNSWATGTDHSYVYTRLTTDTVGANFAIRANTRVIDVSGIISQSGGLVFNSFIVAASPYSFPRPSGSQYTARFANSAGASLDTVPFDVDFTVEEHGRGYSPVNASPFGFTVPAPEGIASVTVLSGATSLATFNVSARPPTVTVLAPNGGETITGTAQIRWQASDPDGDNLNYTVLYSPDGVTRHVLASRLTTTTLNVDFSRLTSSSNARVIVVANDGFNSAEDASDATFVVRGTTTKLFLPVILNQAAGP